ncbi:hypothetical protein TrVE_jg10486 [Triparma verrucosa]|uniref:Carboxypeptidase n=1 Tax=Triparma verrucosa TaxID=1606542 RepID=A0A9W7KUX9_9STRA|nr:hypothetical protein TrVE_jg10486 [Triparma verrucosa]
MKFFGIGLVIAATANAAPEADVVPNLPGYGAVEGLYSGYLEYTLGEKQVSSHYLFSLQDSAVAPSDKLIFWSNGGPGASSFYGFMTEVGPFSLDESSIHSADYEKTGIPTVYKNPTSWNQLGDLLIFEAPAPVGFSFCNDPSADGTSCGDWTDDLAAENNLLALQAFYDKFPELKSKELYLSGESYAGVYIPTMARSIIENDSSINLKGFAVGDACTGTEVLCGDDGDFGPWWDITFMYGHGQFSTKTYDSIIAACTEAALKHPLANGGLSDDCNNLLDKMTEEIGGYYDYALYDDCTYENGLLLSPARPAHTLWRGEIGGALNDYSCGGGDAMEVYANVSAVRDAFHVSPEAYFFSGDNGVGFNYTLTEKNLIPFYKDLAVGKYKDLGVRVMVYNGDTDPGINSFVAQNWTSHVGLEETQPWRSWTLDSCLKMGGYVTRYEGNFDFVTIRGAGHMVPTYKPDAAFEMFRTWIENDDFKRYDGDCEAPSGEL